MVEGITRHLNSLLLDAYFCMVAYKRVPVIGGLKNKLTNHEPLEIKLSHKSKLKWNIDFAGPKNPSPAAIYECESEITS